MYMSICLVSARFRHAQTWFLVAWYGFKRFFEREHFFVHLRFLDASGITFTGEICRNPWLSQMNIHECDKRSIANSCVIVLANVARGGWSRQKKGSTLGRSYQSWRPVVVQMCIPWSGGEGQWKSQMLTLPLMMTKMLNHVWDVSM